ncbi:MAG: FxLYD domain-containing protein [Gemmatimonadetes bacterium]|nr:FxLYD domain-containing protein [Gemmatimonadota bacterium]
MFRANRVLALSGALLAGFAVPAGAQEAAAAAGPTCDVQQMAPTPLAKAAITRNRVVSAKTPADALKDVRDGLKEVFNKGTAENPLGRDFVAAQFLILAVEFGGETLLNGDLNFPGDKKASIDLLVSADSLLDIIEAAKPDCLEETTQWREYKPYAKRIELAYTALQANQLDSAEYSANRALIMSDRAPQAYDVLWRIAAAKDDAASQVKYLQLTVDKLAGDTATTRTRANLMFNLGRVQQEMAEKASGAEKAALYKGADKAYAQVVMEYPASQEAPFAVNGISVAWAMTEDSSSAVALLGSTEPMLDKFSDMALGQLGFIAIRLNNTPAAARVFKAASEVNPYFRDYLYNYAATLFDLKQTTEMLPVVGRLLALDPSNPDNVLLYAYAYKGMADGATNEALKKAYTDSAVAYSTKSDGMKTKVTFTDFDRAIASTTLSGEIENRGNAARTFTVEFEFVDRTGAVIDTQSVTVGPVEANSMGTFKVVAAKGGVAGVRYAPIP